MRYILAVGLVLYVLWIGSCWFGDEPMERIGVPLGGKIEKTEEEWRAQLDPEQFHITREKGTERAFTGKYCDSKVDGIYCCVCCGQPLFDAQAKFDSGTGWPSFWQPVDDNTVSLHGDRSGFMVRTEATCSRCAAHLGHLFNDGPQPTGLRYCMNSAALKLEPRGKEDPGAGSETEGRSSTR